MPVNGLFKTNISARGRLRKKHCLFRGSLEKKVQPLKKRYGYYPFGMVMEGTAYNDEGQQAQLYKFNGNEVLEGEGIPTTLNLMNFNARLYNPALGVFLAVDPQNQFANPYLAFGNNPVLYVDKNGELAFVPWLVATLVNVGIDALNGNINSWGDFGISLAKGAAFSALSGYTKVVQAIAYPVFAAYAPSFNVPIGDNFSLSVSPALFIGSDNLGLGANVTANAQIGDFSLSGGLGLTGFSKYGATGGNKMPEFRGSYGAGYDDGNFGVSLSSTSFRGGGVPQKIATASMRWERFSASLVKKKTLTGKFWQTTEIDGEQVQQPLDMQIFRLGYAYLQVILDIQWKKE